MSWGFRGVRRIVLGTVVLCLFVLPATASAAPAYDGIAGIELPSSDITHVGNFAGAALGQLSGTWAATIDHDQLTYTVGTPTTINDGTFTLRSGGVTYTGLIDSGGTVTPSSLPSGCGNQTFAVKASVTGAGMDPVSGSFSGTLTHYQTMIFRKCVTYSASIVGVAALSTS
jgi:hypothetical protein